MFIKNDRKQESKKLKKGQILEGLVTQVDFPNKGRVSVDGEEREVIVKNAIQGQKVRFSVNKMRKGKPREDFLRCLKNLHLKNFLHARFTICGRCNYQSLPYEEQLKLKENQVKKLLDEVCDDYKFEGIKRSPNQFSYRNKMEFSFGDEVKGGPLCLGMHKRGSFHDIVTVNECQIMDEDFRMILKSYLIFLPREKLHFIIKCLIPVFCGICL